MPRSSPLPTPADNFKFLSIKTPQPETFKQIHDLKDTKVRLSLGKKVKNTLERFWLGQVTMQLKYQPDSSKALTIFAVVLIANFLLYAM